MVHDPELDWWGGSCEALRAVTAAIADRRIDGVGLASLFPAACLVDEAGVAIGDGVLYGDTRAADHVDRVVRSSGSR